MVQHLFQYKLLAQLSPTAIIDEDGSRKIPVVSVQDLLGELSAFVPEIARQAFAEKLASLGAAGLYTSHYCGGDFDAFHSDGHQLRDVCSRQVRVSNFLILISTL